MLDTAILTALSDLTRRLRERTGDDTAAAHMQIAYTDDKPWTIWLHAATIPHRCTSYEACSAFYALEVADRYLDIDSVNRALGWLDEVAWLEASWEHPGGIPQANYRIAEIKQDAAGWWCAEHKAAVAAEREARREAQYRAMLKGAETAFATERRKAS